MFITIALSWLVPSSVLHGIILLLLWLITLLIGPIIYSFARTFILIGVNVIKDYYGWGRYGHLPHPHRELGRLSWNRIKQGDFRHILIAPPVEGHRDFVKQAGSDVLVYRLPFWRPRLLLGNEGAILRILSKEHAYSFPKPAYIRGFLARSLGDGLFVVEGTLNFFPGSDFGTDYFTLRCHAQETTQNPTAGVQCFGAQGAGTVLLLACSSAGGPLGTGNRLVRRAYRRTKDHGSDCSELPRK